MVDFIYWTKAYLSESAALWVTTLKSWILRAILTVIILIILLWISVFLYGSFYYAYMPTMSFTRPVYFQFRPPLSKKCGAVSDKRDTSDYYCSFPTANITLVQPGREQVMLRGQSYRVTMDLDMPESLANQEMGMFLIQMQFYARDGTIVKSSSRPAILKYRSGLLQALETILFCPLLMIGTTEQKQSLHVEIFSDFTEDAYKPTVGVAIEIQSYKIQLYSAKLKINAQFTGLRYIMFYYPFMCAFVGISTNMFFLLTIAFFSWFRFLWKKTGGNNLERVDSRRVIFDQPVSLEDRRRNLRELLESEERDEEERRRSSQDSSNSELTNPKIITPEPPGGRSSLDEEDRKSSSDDDAVIISQRDLDIHKEQDDHDGLRLRQSDTS